MSRRTRRRWLYVACPVAFLLHNDFWLWSDARLVWGLPVGLAYHVAYCVGISVLMGVVVSRVDR